MNKSGSVVKASLMSKFLHKYLHKIDIFRIKDNVTRTGKKL